MTNNEPTVLQIFRLAYGPFPKDIEGDPACYVTDCVYAQDGHTHPIISKGWYTYSWDKGEGWVECPWELVGPNIANLPAKPFIDFFARTWDTAYTEAIKNWEMSNEYA